MIGVSRNARPWLHAGVVVLGCNAAFAILLLSANAVPRDVIVARIRAAFAAGDLVERDRLLHDSQRGYNQYTDCSLLQMMTNPDDSVVNRSFGPWLCVEGTDFKNMCRTLRAIIVDGGDPTRLTCSRYTRYWHGYIPVFSALLSAFDVATARRAMRAAAYASLLCLGIAGVCRSWFLPFVGPLVVAGTLFWGLSSFGLNVSHASGDAVAVLGTACVVLWGRALSRPATLLPFAAAYGAIVVYFDMLTGPLPTAAGLLVPTVYLASRLHRHDDPHLGLAGLALAGFAFGAILTLACKVALVVALVRPMELDAFVGNLDLYTGAVRSDSPLPSVMLPLAHLLKQGGVLTYGSRSGMALLYASAGIAWLLSAWRAWRSSSVVDRRDWAAFAIGASSIPAWSLVLPTHTNNHAEFMARILIVPIALGWASVFWQISRARTERRSA